MKNLELWAHLEDNGEIVVTFTTINRSGRYGRSGELVRSRKMDVLRDALAEVSFKCIQLGSSMDFATEFGYSKNDAAKNILRKAVRAAT